MKKLKNIFFYFLYGSFIIKYKTSNKLDILLIYLNDIGIKSYKIDSSYFSTITYNDGTTFKFCNENRWYAWMRFGKINFSNGKELTWNGIMPNYEVLFKYKKIINKLNKKSENIDFNEYLPKQLLRKRKLQKLGITK